MSISGCDSMEISQAKLTAKTKYADATEIIIYLIDPVVIASWPSFLLEKE